MNNPIPSKPLILFDGVCNLCNHSVNFIIKHDPHGLFLFAPLQGKSSQHWLKSFPSDNISGSSVILIQNGKMYQHSTAALRIAGQLKGPAKLLYIFLAVPRFIRDAVYKWIAHNRYRWFGKKDSCMMPTPELASRFITD